MPNTRTTGRRELICSWCSQSFSKQEHLSRHVRSHTREKPFACCVCKKAFSRNDTLLRHARGHRSSTNAQPHGSTIMSDSRGSEVTGQPTHQPGQEPGSMDDSAEVVSALLGLQQPMHHNSNAPTRENLHAELSTFDHISYGNFPDLPPSSSARSDVIRLPQDALAPSRPSRWRAMGSSASGIPEGLSNTIPSNPNLDELEGSHHDGNVWDTNFDSQIPGWLASADFDLNALNSSIMAAPPGWLLEDLGRQDFEQINCHIHASATSSRKEDLVRQQWFTFLGSHDTGYITPDVGAEQIQVDERYRDDLSQRLQPRIPYEPLPSTDFLASLIGQTFGMLSGRPRDLLLVQSFHGTVITWARRCGMFQQKRVKDKVCDMLEHDLERAWKLWAQAEEQSRVAAALYIHDAEYSALFNAEPFMRHSTSKLPSICSNDLWMAPTAQEWKKVLTNASGNMNALQIPPLSQEQDRFGTYCELEGIAASIVEAKELGTWPNVSHQLELSLLQFHDKYLKSELIMTHNSFCLEVLWHSTFISLFADLNRLEISSGRDGYEESQRHLDYARTWAHSQDGQRCALHGALILRKLENMSIGAEPAIHVPRVLYCAAMVWYCYTEFGQGDATDGPAQKDEFSEFKKLGTSSQKLLFEAHGFKTSRPTRLESSTLCGLVDLLRRIGHWRISRKLASLMITLVHGVTEGETSELFY